MIHFLLQRGVGLSFPHGTITPRSIISKLLQPEHHANDIFPDIVDVALDRRQQDLAA